MMIDAELLNNEGCADEALALIVAAQLRPDAVEGDCTPYCLRASILINKVSICGVVSWLHGLSLTFPRELILSSFSK